MNTTEEIWHEYHERLTLFIRSKVYGDEVEDLLQDVFAKVHKRLESVKDDSKLESWIFQITRNVIMDYYRANRPTENLPNWLEEADHTEEQDVRKEFSSCLQPIIQRLPEKYREAVQLAEIDQKSQKEVAEQIGLSLSGVKSRVQRGRRLLNGLLHECCEIELNQRKQLISYRNKDGSCGDC